MLMRTQNSKLPPLPGLLLLHHHRAPQPAALASHWLGHLTLRPHDIGPRAAEYRCSSHRLQVCVFSKSVTVEPLSYSDKYTRFQFST